MFLKKIKVSELHSGERETATSILEISKHSIYRYNFVLDYLKNYFYSKEINGLDIFCGNGYGTFFLAKYLNLQMIVGIDGCEDAIKQAKKYYKRSNNKFKHKIFPFRLENNKYDFIVCLESIEHINEQNLLLKNMYNALKKGSILFISTPNKDFFPKTSEDKFHKKLYNSDELENLLIKYNFEILDKYGQNVFSKDNNNKINGLLHNSDRTITKNINSQHIIYVCKK